MISEQPRVIDDHRNDIPNGGEDDKATGTPGSDDQNGGNFHDVEMETDSNQTKFDVNQNQSNNIPNDKEDRKVNGAAVSHNHDGVQLMEVWMEKSEKATTEQLGEKQSSNSNSSENNGHISNYIPAIKLQIHLPEPQPPKQEIERSQSVSMAENIPSLGKYIRDRSSTFSAAIIKRLSSLREDNGDFWAKNDSFNFEVTEFKIPGVKVLVKLKTEDQRTELIGRITFFSKSNCRDCTAVRKFFRENGFRFVEINVDVFPKRAKELLERTGSSQVPQIFFNEKLLGGLVTLNSLRNSGELDKVMKQLLVKKCPDEAPAIPVYGFNDQEEEEDDELVPIVKALRQSLPIQDRLIRMKIVKNCFAGADMVEAIIQHLDCGRKKAIETAKQLAKKHFIHHVFGENDFEEGKNYYRFLEHEPFIVGCFNFRNTINDSEPKSASFLANRLNKLMSAILEAYASDDRLHVNYFVISKSEEFRRYLNLTRDLQRINLQSLTPYERLAFFLNLYNAMIIHAGISIGHPEGILHKRAFYSDFQYVVGGHPYSLNNIENGILRFNRKSPNSLIRPFSNGDRRLEFAASKVNPLIHFGLCNGTRSSPVVRFFTPQSVESELRSATREYFLRGGIEIDLDKRTVHLTRIIKWFSVDFGAEKDILKWVLNYLDSNRAGLLTHLLSDGGPINIVYQSYDWSGNF